MAVELRNAGHRVTVFEQSHAELKGLLGAGLGTPTPMFQTLLERGLVDPDLPHMTLEFMEFVGRVPGSRRGHVALRLPPIFVAFHWGDFYRRLRAKVPDDVYLAGRAVERVASEANGAVIQLGDGTEHGFDLAVAGTAIARASGVPCSGLRPRVPWIRVLARAAGGARDGAGRADGFEFRALRVPRHARVLPVSGHRRRRLRDQGRAAHQLGLLRGDARRRP
jgi:hypothetical protein